MSPFAHSLQIVSLATWLSLVLAGGVGLVLKQDDSSAEVRPGERDGQGRIDARLMGELPAAPVPARPNPLQRPVLVLAAPPELPAVPDFGPLPQLPKRVAVTELADSGKPRQTSPNGVSRKPDPDALAVKPPPSNPASSAGGDGATPNTGNTANTGNAGGADADRLARGTMPKPLYPREARRRGQEGTVVVEFTVDASGRVVSATAVKPSPWPLLNREAIRAVRRWKFPQGDVMNLQRPVIFKLR